jgi:hypothetical protein
MNDTMSLLLATGILAVGGLGLFMYKNTSEEESYEETSDDKNSENWFDLRSIFRNSDEDEDEKEEPEVYEPKSRARGSKTKSVRKTTGTKRRY